MGVGVLLLPVGETRDAAQHPTLHRTPCREGWPSELCTVQAERPQPCGSQAPRNWLNAEACQKWNCPSESLKEKKNPIFSPIPASGNTLQSHTCEPSQSWSECWAVTVIQTGKQVNSPERTPILWLFSICTRLQILSYCCSVLGQQFPFFFFFFSFFPSLLPSDWSWVNSGVGCKNVFIKGCTRFLTISEFLRMMYHVTNSLNCMSGLKTDFLSFPKKLHS